MVALAVLGAAVLCLLVGFLGGGRYWCGGAQKTQAPGRHDGGV